MMAAVDFGAAQFDPGLHTFQDLKVVIRLLVPCDHIVVRAGGIFVFFRHDQLPINRAAFLRKFSCKG